MSDYRKPVCTGRVGVKDVNIMVVVCDDGSIWRLNGNEWQEGPPIPGSDRDADLTGKKAKPAGWVF